MKKQKTTREVFDELNAMVTKSDHQIAEYDVPGIGKIRLFKSQDSQYHGKYYARMEEEGIAVRLCKSEDELRYQTGEYVFNRLRDKELILQTKLAPVKDSMEKMSLSSVKRNILDCFKVN